MSDISIVFMGTPEFAVGILDHLYETGHTIKAVVTAPDKPAGRGQKLKQSAVKDLALSKGLPILQPVNLKDEEFILQLQEINADLFVVVAFRMLPKVVWSMPKFGTINLHGSLLPDYRGAAPINWAIINGEKETGVTTFFIEEEIDTGSIIEQSITAIGENETVGDVYHRLMKMGAALMESTIDKIRNNDVHATPQNELIKDSVKSAPKIFKNDCKIDFSRTVENVHNFCRGLSPYPGAWCVLNNEATGQPIKFKILTTRKTTIPVERSQHLKSDKSGILIPCSDFYVQVLELQPEGKRKMTFAEYLAGNSIETLTI